MSNHLPTFTRCSAYPPQTPSVATGKLSNTLQPFHLAFPVHNLDAARKFYGEILGLEEGRSAKRWVDYNLCGNQIVCQLVDNYVQRDEFSNSVDADQVPVPHFGLALTVGKPRVKRYSL